jgi:hypothetical protein
MSAAQPTPDNPTLALLSQLGVEDQRLSQVAQLMSAFESRDAEAAELAQLRTENGRLKELNRTLLAHSDFLAAAVGACPECWGEDAECRECGGQGGPGAYVPERICFEEIVRPVLDRMRQRLAARRRRAQPAPERNARSERAPAPQPDPEPKETKSDA